MAKRKASEKKRGPKGGVKHQPGRGHDLKSLPVKKARFKRKAARKRKQQQDEARKAWDEWDRLSEEAKHLLGPDGQPKMPRPKDEK
jgi:hypothetical protein